MPSVNEMIKRVNNEKERVEAEMEKEPAREFEFALTGEKRLHDLIMGMMYGKEEPSGFGTMPKPGLNCAYGVQDRENNIFVTQCGCTSQCIKQTYDETDDYEFAVILNHAYQFCGRDYVIVGTVSCQVKGCSDIPLFLSVGSFSMDKEMNAAARKNAPIIRQAIRHYLNWCESLSFEEKFEAETGQKMYNYSKNVSMMRRNILDKCGEDINIIYKKGISSCRFTTP